MANLRIECDSELNVFNCLYGAIKLVEIDCYIDLYRSAKSVRKH
jgi:hypothetical protein